MISNAESFRKSVLDDLFKRLIEQKNDSKKFLDDARRRYEAEHRKVSFVEVTLILQNKHFI